MGPLLVRANSLISRFLQGSGSSAIPRIAQRIGVAGTASAGRLANLAKSNKLTTAIILWEMGDMGAELLNEMVAEDAEVKRLVELFGSEPDVVEDTESVTDITRFSDEFAIISDAINHVGTYERLLTIKKALALPDDVFKLYYTTRSMAAGLR